MAFSVGPSGQTEAMAVTEGRDLDHHHRHDRDEQRTCRTLRERQRTLFPSLHSTVMSSATTSQSGTSPSEFLKSIKGKPVVVKLNSGVDYRGLSLNINITRGKDHVQESCRVSMAT